MNCATFAEMAVLIRNFFYKKRGGKKKRRIFLLICHLCGFFSEKTTKMKRGISKNEVRNVEFRSQISQIRW
jgi:hypothetical protein